MLLMNNINLILFVIIAHRLITMIIEMFCIQKIHLIFKFIKFYLTYFLAPRKIEGMHRSHDYDFGCD